MALNDIVQYLEDGSGLDTSDRRKVATFKAGGTITAGQAVAFDLSKTADGDKALYVVPADSDATATLVFAGIALAAAASGETVKVCTGGLCEANVSTSTVAGDRLVVGPTAGELAIWADQAVDEGGAATYTIFTKQLCALATEADTAGVATVFVVRQF